MLGHIQWGVMWCLGRDNIDPRLLRARSCWPMNWPIRSNNHRALLWYSECPTYLLHQCQQEELIWYLIRHLFHLVAQIQQLVCFLCVMQYLGPVLTRSNMLISGVPMLWPV